MRMDSILWKTTFYGAGDNVVIDNEIRQGEPVETLLGNGFSDIILWTGVLNRKEDLNEGVLWRSLRCRTWFFLIVSEVIPLPFEREAPPLYETPRLCDRKLKIATEGYPFPVLLESLGAKEELHTILACWLFRGVEKARGWSVMRPEFPITVPLTTEQHVITWFPVQSTTMAIPTPLRPSNEINRKNRERERHI
ncbi:hypothetical protein CEXT_470961 [Caerostris extrusa]|uniref:Uncharacterized protein n=1 Tax=Caerostris extrusa TaxID=172846 RepID=A0AAV4Y095_CAEEX|nr:hypothetical protein CEXT_470961 [Caerostris extrusa]